MGDGFGRFEYISKPLWSMSFPIQICLLLKSPVKSGIDLNRIEPFSIKIKPMTFCQVLGIETALPVIICPARSSNKVGERTGCSQFIRACSTVSPSSYFREDVCTSGNAIFSCDHETEFSRE
jgi:hypothetical protein